MAEVLFPPTEWEGLGVNGFSKSAGIHLRQVGAEVFMQPISIKGNVVRTRLVVPVTHLREVRDAIDEILASQGGD